MNRSRMIAGLLSGGLLSLCLVIGVGGKAEASSFVLKNDLHTLLLAGLDHDPTSKNPDRRTDWHTDSLALLVTKKGSGVVSALHIPRDTLVTVPGVGSVKINSVRMLYGDHALRQAVEMLTGFPVKAVLDTDFPRFKNAFARLGDVYFYVDRPIDPPEGRVRMASGIHRLSPEEALTVARFRHEPLGDIGRVQRQARLLYSAILAMRKLSYPAFLAVVAVLDPRFSREEARSLYFFAHQMKSYHAYMVPGWFGVGREYGDFVADRWGMRAIRAAIVAPARAASVATALRHRLDARDVGVVKIL